MRKIPVDELKDGMILGKAVFNERADVLLHAGVALRTDYIAALRQRGYAAVYVRDGLADDVSPPDLVSQRTQAAMERQVRGILEIAKQHFQQPSGRQGRQRLTQPLDQMAQDIERLIDEVLEKDVLSGLVSLKSHDNYSFCHSVDVTIIGLLLGRRLWLDRDRLRQLAKGCLLHDVGKLLIGTSILQKPGPLTSHEWEVMREHPEEGYRMAASLLPEDATVARHIIWQHHERQDGSGYPRGLKGTNSISFGDKDGYSPSHIIALAEIVAVADVYSALASDRPYRPALAPEVIFATIRDMAGSHLNAEAVAAFLSILPSFPIGHWVLVSGTAWHGYAGVVIRNTPGRLDRPVIRLLLNERKQRIVPLEVDTAREPALSLATCDIPPCPTPLPDDTLTA